MTDRPASWRMPTPKQMEKLAAGAARKPGPSPMLPSRPNIGIRSLKILAPTRPGPSFGNDVLRRSSATCCASPAGAASGPSKSRRPVRSDCMAATRSGRTWRSGCSTTPASSAQAGMKKTGAGRRSRRRSRSGSPIGSLIAPGCPDGPEVSPYACRAAARTCGVMESLSTKPVCGQFAVQHTLVRHRHLHATKPPNDSTTSAVSGGALRVGAA